MVNNEMRMNNRMFNFNLGHLNHVKLLSDSYKSCINKIVNNKQMNLNVIFSIFIF